MTRDERTRTERQRRDRQQAEALARNAEIRRWGFDVRAINVEREPVWPRWVRWLTAMF